MPISKGKPWPSQRFHHRHSGYSSMEGCARGNPSASRGMERGTVPRSDRSPCSVCAGMHMRRPAFTGAEFGDLGVVGGLFGRCRGGFRRGLIHSSANVGTAWLFVLARSPSMPLSLPVLADVEYSDRTIIPLAHLDDLFVSGRRHALQPCCTHCFISCSPHNDSFGFSRSCEGPAGASESALLGVKEYYFTGGEPFLNRDLVPMLETTLASGPRPS